LKSKAVTVAKPELGAKRICPTTGKKFYDMNRDPIVSPYTGQAYPRAMFEPLAKGVAAAPAAARPRAAEDEPDVEPVGAELVSLDEVAESEAEKDTVVDEDIEVAEDVGGEDDTFLEEEEEGEDDVSGLIDGDIENDEEA
jgi:uncharacterized protein (TIGR02300 family)